MGGEAIEQVTAVADVSPDCSPRVRVGESSGGVCGGCGGCGGCGCGGRRVTKENEALRNRIRALELEDDARYDQVRADGIHQAQSWDHERARLEEGMALCRYCGSAVPGRPPPLDPPSHPPHHFLLRVLFFEPPRSAYIWDSLLSAGTSWSTSGR